MTPYLPAICINHRCKTIFFAESPVTVLPGQSIRVGGILIEACPDCVNLGLVPDCKLTALRLTVLDKEKSRRVGAALKIVGDNPLAYATNAEIEAFLATQPSWLQPLRKYLPKNNSELMVTIGTLSAVCTLVVTTYNSNKPTTIMIDEKLIPVIKDLIGKEPPKEKVKEREIAR